MTISPQHYSRSCLISMKFILVFLLLIWDIFIASSMISDGENENSLEAISLTKLNPYDSLICKETHSSNVCIPPGYNKEMGPWKYRHLTDEQMPWYFIMDFYIFDVQEINDQKLTITFDVYFKLKWSEPRFQVNTSSDTWQRGTTLIDGEKYYLLPLDIREDLWIPALEMHNVESFLPQKIFRESASLRINGKKLIRYIAKVKIVLTCQMTFNRFPFDSHTCFYHVGSFFHPIEIWSCSSNVHFNDTRQRSLQYDISINDLPHEEGTLEEIMSGRTWAVCGFQINLVRKKGQIFIQVYLTSFLLIILAWVSFIVNPDVVPGRMGLLVTVFLVLINIFISVKRDAPSSNGFLNAVDTYVFVSIGHVFFAFLEYAFILFGFGQTTFFSALALTKMIKKFNKVLNRVKTTPSTIAVGNNNHRREMDCPGTNRRKRQWNELDLISMVAYPISFTLFSVIYFSRYLKD